MAGISKFSGLVSCPICGVISYPAAQAIDRLMAPAVPTLLGRCKYSIRATDSGASLHDSGRPSGVGELSTTRIKVGGQVWARIAASTRAKAAASW